MVQDDSQHTQHKQDPVEEHEQNSQIKQIKTQKSRVSAPLIDSGCYQFGFVRFGNASPPAVSHCGNRSDENDRSHNTQDSSNNPTDQRKKVSSGCYADNLICQNKPDADFQANFHKPDKSGLSFLKLICLDSLFLLGNKAEKYSSRKKR